MSEPDKRPSWNTTFKAFFDFKEAIIELLKGWGPEDVVSHLDLRKEAIEACDTSFITGLAEERNADKLYKIPYADKSHAYIWLHLELQRKPYRWMALRMLEYWSAIHRRSIRETPPTALPPVLPFVLSQADTGWSAPRFLSELIAVDRSSPLARFQPKFEYFVLEACNAQLLAEFPLLSGVLRAPYGTFNPRVLRLLIAGARAYKNLDLTVVIDAIMRNFVTTLLPEESVDMQTLDPENPTKTLDVWDAFVARVEQEREETSQKLQRLAEAESRIAESKAIAQRASQEAQRASQEAQRASQEAERASQEVQAERQRAIHSLKMILEGRFNYKAPDQTLMALTPVETHRALTEAATAPALGSFLDAVGWDVEP